VVLRSWCFGLLFEYLIQNPTWILLQLIGLRGLRRAIKRVRPRGRDAADKAPRGTAKLSAQEPPLWAIPARLASSRDSSSGALRRTPVSAPSPPLGSVAPAVRRAPPPPLALPGALGVARAGFAGGRVPVGRSAGGTRALELALQARTGAATARACTPAADQPVAASLRCPRRSSTRNSELVTV
jgi:hypothetical protein